jgi:sulfite reductase (NADPH) flavoprotein alpha-component
MLKKVIFQLHWLLGISAGLVLMVIGVSGALLAFERELLSAINPPLSAPQPAETAMLAPAEWVAKAETAVGQRVVGVSQDNQAASAVRLFFSPAAGERRGAMRYLDPYTGELLGEPAGQGFFQLMQQLHRFLVMGEVGKQITAASTLALVFFCLSGLYLRWPRQTLNWRSWLRVDWAKQGRAFNWDLHAVFGTWCLVFYLCASLTGLYWSYDWYRDGATRLLGDAPSGQSGGKPSERRGAHEPAPSEAAPRVDLAALWPSVQTAAGPQLVAWNLRLPAAAGQPVTVAYLLADAAHARALNQLTLDPLTGQVQRHARYADKPIGAQLLASVYALHVGEYFGLPGRILMALASAALPLFGITGWLLYLDRRRKKRGLRALKQSLLAPVGAANWLIGFASQSGYAEQLAWQTAGQLQAAGLAVQVSPLARWNAAMLAQAERVLLVVSTFGDGQAPDSARGFERRLLGQSLGLGHLRFAMLALGDRQYPEFCGFASRVQHWLAAQGAQPLFGAVQVDNADAAAIASWQSQLRELTGVALPVLSEPVFAAWRLLSCECLNLASSGAPSFLLRLQAPAGADWQAGDVLQVLPANDRTLGVRDYSIASLPSDGVLELLVRQQRGSDGVLGLGSGWLTAQAQVGMTLAARVRANPNFQLPEAVRPLILLGNGTGLAGLRSLLKARITAGQTRNWLLFGERHAAHDFYWREQVQGWLASGELARLDLAFSRDQSAKLYVQDRLHMAAEQLQRWVSEGAAIYVCGSLQGMAGGVDRVLREVLGSAQVDALQEAGRYRRDVY